MESLSRRLLRPLGVGPDTIKEFHTLGGGAIAMFILLYGPWQTWPLAYLFAVLTWHENVDAHYVLLGAGFVLGVNVLV